MLGIWTRGCKMVGADKTTVLWQPHIFSFFTYLFFFLYIYVYFLVVSLSIIYYISMYHFLIFIILFLSLLLNNHFISVQLSLSLFIFMLSVFLYLSLSLSLLILINCPFSSSVFFLTLPHFLLFSWIQFSSKCWLCICRQTSVVQKFKLFFLLQEGCNYSS